MIAEVSHYFPAVPMYSPIWQTTEGPVMPGPLLMGLFDQVDRVVARNKVATYEAVKVAGAYPDPDKPREKREIESIIEAWCQTAGFQPEDDA